MSRTRILVLFAQEWDRLALDDPQLAHRFEFIHRGFDLFRFPENARLLTFDIRAYVERMVALGRRLGVEGVISPHEQFGTLVAALVARRLNLPGPDPAAILTAQHKYYARVETAKAAPQAVPPFGAFPYTVRHEAELPLPFPFFVKPVKGTFIYAATNQGFKRSVNSGTSWSNILTGESWTVAIKPDNSNIIYTVMDNGSSSKFYKSTDQGAVFIEKPTGWFVPGSGESVYGVRLTVSQANSNIIYALLGGDGTNLNGYIGVYKSTNAGESWTNPHGTIRPPYNINTHPNLMAHNGTDVILPGFL